MASIYFPIYLALLKSSLYATVVERGTQDTFSADKCWKLNAYRDTECKCYKHLTTYASQEFGGLTCTSAKKMKCEILPEIKLITAKEKLVGTVDNKCGIANIKIWNVPTESINEKGIWVDVTYIASQYLYLNKTTHQSRLVSNLPVTLWAGQLISVIFDCNDACALFKVEGRILYPFDRTKLVVTTSRPGVPGISTTIKPNKTSKSFVYIIIGIFVVVAIILIFVAYFCRHKLPRCKRYQQENTTKTGEIHIYSEPTHVALLPSSSNTNITTKGSGDEVYYSTIDPLSISEASPSILSDDKSCVNNPVYTDASPRIIKIDDYEVYPGNNRHYHELENDTGNKDVENSKATYENVDI